jgi:O-antigen/teichoic acid export membrane protein
VSELDRKLVRGSAWLALSFGGSQIVLLVVTAIVARFIAPSDFGLVGLASIAIVGLTTLQESGLGLAVIHRRTDVERAAGTVFVFHVCASVVLYALAFAIAPWLANVFSTPRLGDVLRVLALAIIVRGLGDVPGTMIERDLVFASRARGELGGAIVQALVAVPLAVEGYGVWSLVVGQIAGQAVQSLTFWLVTPLRPSPRLFSFQLLRELSRYGRHVTGANVVGFLDSNVDTATVGKLLGSADVGFYNIAWRLANVPATVIGYIIGRVMFPVYASIQHDRFEFQRAFVTNVRRNTLIALPVGVGMIFAANPIVVGLFGERWVPAVAPLRILAVFGIVRAFSGTTGPVIQAAGKPQLVLLLSIWHLAVICAALFALTPPFGLRGAAAAVLIAGLSSLLPAFRFALRALGLPVRELISNIGRPALCSVPLAICLFILQFPIGGLAPGAQLALLVTCGAAVYGVAAVALARRELKAIAAAFR